MDSASVTRALVGVRLAVGTAAWATPGLIGSAFGLKPAKNPQAPYLSRLFGVRDAALGFGVLQSEGAAQRQWLQIGVACDVCDAAAALMGGRAGYLSPPVAAMLLAPAVGAAALGVLALREPPAAPAV